MTAASSEREFSVAGGTIHAEIAGAGPPVVLLHGWMLDRRLWRAQLAGLAQHFSVVAIDRRGFGLSTAPPGLAREPYDILAIQRQLGAEQIGLVAMSQAGRIALTFVGCMRPPS
jgi:pimeloyl-ACP methyl ester carboxylesterase